MNIKLGPLCLFIFLQAYLAADEPVELLKTVIVPGIHRDLSGLTQELKPGIHHDLFGGISALEYLGRDDLYLALPDRGPLDGAVDWACRFHVVRIQVEDSENDGEDFSVLETHLLKAKKRIFSGLHSRFEAADGFMERLDPEGVRAGSVNSFFLSDEYGPSLLEFDYGGNLLRQLPVAEQFKVNVPGKTKAEENRQNTKGRQGNRGLEGLAITDDKKNLMGLFQSPLLQDCERDSKGKPTGVNCRLVEFGIEHDRYREFVYQLESPKNKLNEILTLAENQYLVIERDGKPGRQAKFKKVIKIDVTSASVLNGKQALPAMKLPPDIRPVAKSTFIDLLGKRFGLAGNKMPEKIESLAFGPTLQDGRRTLLVASDNDFQSDQPTLIYCFAIGNPGNAERITK